MAELDRLEDLQDVGPDWSISRLQIIMHCGMRYKFRYIDKAPELPGPPLAFGTALHRTIETLHLTNHWEDSSAQRLWSDEWYAAQVAVDWSATQYRKSTFDNKGPKILETYISKHKADQWLGLEVNFRTAFGD